MSLAGRVHHSAIVARDVERSLRFYRDGLGLEVLMEGHFDGDWPTLFDAPSTRLRSVFLGDPGTSSSGVVELVSFEDPGAPSGPGVPSGQPAPTPPAAGFFLLSFFVEVDAVLARLAELGNHEVRRIEVPGPSGTVAMATLRDPDGVMIELVGAPQG